MFIDQFVRKNKKLHFLIKHIDKSNYKFLQKNICNIEYFTENHNNFFILILHVKDDIKLQLKYYILFRKYIKNKYELSCLKDKITSNLFGLQHFGTQLKEDGDVLKFIPIIGIATKFDHLDSDKIEKLNHKRLINEIDFVEDYIRQISNSSNKIVSRDIYNK